MWKRTVLLTILLGALALGNAPCGLCQQDVSEIIAEVQKTERNVVSATGTTEIQIEDNRTSPYGNGAVLGNSHSVFEWVFSAPEWRLEEKYSRSPYTAESTKTTGYRENMYTILAPGKPGPIMMIYGPNCRGKVAVTPTFAQYLGLAHLLEDRPPPSEAMLGADLQISRKETLEGVETIVMSGVSASGQTVTWWIAPDYGYRVVKREWRWMPDDDSPYNQAVVVHTYNEFAEVTQGVWLPRRKSVTKTCTRDDGTVVLALQVTASNTYESVNTSVNQDMLSIVPTAGAQVVYREEVDLVEPAE